MGFSREKVVSAFLFLWEVLGFTGVHKYLNENGYTLVTFKHPRDGKDAYRMEKIER